MKIYSLEKSLYELFDFKINTFNIETFISNHECLIYKSDGLKIISTDILFNQHKFPFYNLINNTLTENLIAYISRDQNNLYFERKFNGEILKGRVWLPLVEIRNNMNFSQSKNSQKEISNNLKKYILHQGDVIKFGKIEFKVRAIQLEGTKHKSFPILTKAFNPKPSLVNNINEIDNTLSKRFCRVCFGDNEIESPLINPCKCSGGIKYIHLNCLHHWLKTKRIKKSKNNQHCIIYVYTKILCELCKTPFPDFVQSGNKFYEVWSFVEPEYLNYIVLESIENPNLSNNSHLKTICIINFQNKNVIKIGRKHCADLSIKDTSVSRLHATIELVKIDNKNEIILKDNNSKFGSHVELLCDKIPICNEPGLTVQFGKSIVNFSVIVKTKILSCLSCSFRRSFQKEVNYNKLNNEYINATRVFTFKEETNGNENKEEKYKGKEITNEEIQEDNEDLDQSLLNETEVLVYKTQDFNLRKRNKEYFAAVDCEMELHKDANNILNIKTEQQLNSFENNILFTVENNVSNTHRLIKKSSIDENEDAKTIKKQLSNFYLNIQKTERKKE